MFLEDRLRDYDIHQRTKVTQTLWVDHTKDFLTQTQSKWESHVTRLRVRSRMFLLKYEIKAIEQIFKIPKKIPKFSGKNVEQMMKIFRIKILVNFLNQFTVYIFNSVLFCNPNRYAVFHSITCRFRRKRYTVLRFHK